MSKTPGRPDNWVENLGIENFEGDDLDELNQALVPFLERFGVSRPVVLVGENTSSRAVDQFTRINGLAVEAVDTFFWGTSERLGTYPTRFPEADVWATHDAVVCLDGKPAAYLNAVQFCHHHGLKLPVLTDYGRLPAQASQIGLSRGEIGSDIYVYNYFSRLYRVKDPIQLVWQAVWSDGITRWGTRILGPNENIRIRPEDLHASPGDGVGTLVYHAYHPAFARVPNSRFRGYGDYCAAGTCITAHGDELEPKRAEAGGWFDVHLALLGGEHDIVAVVRNDPAKPEPIAVRLVLEYLDRGEAAQAEVTVASSELVHAVSLAELFHAGEVPRQARVVATVRGNSYRLEWRERRGEPGGRGARYLGNHGSTNDIALLPLIHRESPLAPAPEAVLGKLAGMEARGVMLFPYPLPVLPAGSGYRYGFSAGKFLPRIETMKYAAFDADGTLVDRGVLRLPGTLAFVDQEDLPFWPKLADRGGLVLLSPPYVEQRMLTYLNCREDLWIRVRNAEGGDADITEFQMHNRNLRGYTLPIGFGQASGMIKARTELMIRYRCEDGFMTLLTLLNASPEIGFDRTAYVDLEFNRPDGSAMHKAVEIGPQAQKTLDLGELLGEATEAEPGFGWVRVVSDNAALSGYAALCDRRHGAVGLQHLLGA